MSSQKFITSMSLTAAVLLGSAITAKDNAVAATITIDEFNSVQEVSLSGDAPVTGTSSQAALDAIGGWREIYLEKTSGADGELVRARSGANAGTLGALTTENAFGTLRLTYDANGAGLGLNLPDYDQFETLIIQSDQTLQIDSRLCVDLACTKYLQKFVSFPFTPAASPFLVTSTIASYSLFGGASFNDTIQKIEFTLNSNEEFGLDMSLDYVRLRRSTSVAEPGLVLGLGSFVFASFFLAKKKRNA